jgi:hypothetical protein
MTFSPFPGDGSAVARISDSNFGISTNFEDPCTIPCL